MKIALRPCRRLPQVPWWLSALVFLWAMTALCSVWLAAATHEGPSLCHVRQFTGVACPACGSTRATVKVLTADPLGGLRENPLVMAAGFIVAGVLVIRLVLGRQLIVQMSGREQIMAAILLVVLVAFNWMYVLFHHGGSLSVK